MNPEAASSQLIDALPWSIIQPLQELAGLLYPDPGRLAGSQPYV